MGDPLWAQLCVLLVAYGLFVAMMLYVRHQVRQIRDIVDDVIIEKPEDVDG